MGKLKKRLDGRYCKQVLISTDAAGKRHYKQFYGTTIKGVEKSVGEFKAMLGHGLDPEQMGTTFEKLCDTLITTKRAQGIGVKSLARLEDNKKHFGGLLARQAAELRAADFQAVLNALGDWHDGMPPLSHWTLGNLRSFAKSAYTLAIPEVVQYNPLEKVVVPAGKPAEPREPISPEQQKWITEMPHRAQRAAMLMMYSGLRRGEATVLTWADIDISAGTITVNKSFDFGAKKVKLPKTAAGVRTVNIPSVLVDYLRAQKDNCLYVLHNDKGQMLTEQAWKRLWESYMIDLNAKYGYDGQQSKNKPGGLPMVIRTFTPHQLRHTFCTLLYMAGVDVLTARDQMGHKDISVTMGIYTHLEKVHKRKSMCKLDDYLKNSGASQTQVKTY